SGMAMKIVVIGARNSCENAGAAISVAAAAAALTATCVIPMVPLLNQGEARVAVYVLRALSTGAVWQWSAETVAAAMRFYFLVSVFFSSNSARGFSVSSSLDLGTRST